MKKVTVQIIIHIAAWACFLLLPLVFYPRPREHESSFFPEHYFTTQLFVNFAIIVAFYYLNTYVFIPKLLDTKKFVAYTLLILALLIFYGSVPRIYHAVFGPSPYFTSLSTGSGQFGAAAVSGSGAPDVPATPGVSRLPGSLRPPRPRNPPLLSPGNLVIFLMVFVLSTGIKVINQWLQSEQRAKEIANEKLKAELSFLKAQINPHFLFNTLNNIYALASDRSDQTAPAVMKLSSIMRYVLTEAKNDLVPLEKEILFTSHYIELQKMRLTDKTRIDFTINGDPPGREIAPLLLLPFVENAFKYGISTRECSPIRICMDIKEESLYFSISNHKHFNTALRMADNTGIGISNTRRRLDLLYPGKYELIINDKSNEFTVHLNIPV
ncbi:MAG TPA: sensor histidine kinase [Puia sp.]|nr:sensor histidine kinase [Puia sp.]